MAQEFLEQRIRSSESDSEKRISGLEDKNHQLKKENFVMKKRIEKLEKLLTVDELTGALNRRGAKDVLNRLFKEVSFSRAETERRRFRFEDLCVLFLDVDNFKNLNDTYGHKVGDQILRWVTEILQNKIRGTDYVVRWGGEEFLVILPGMTELQGLQKAEAIRLASQNRIKIPSYPDLQVTFSIGVSTIGESGSADSDELIKKADEAMYVAKHDRGKNTVVSFGEMKGKSRE